MTAGAVAISFAPIFVRVIDLPPTSIAFYRCALGGLIIMLLRPLLGSSGFLGKISDRRKEAKCRATSEQAPHEIQGIEQLSREPDTIPGTFPERIFFWLKSKSLLAWVPATCFAIDLTLWHKSIIWVGAGLSTVLANTQIFFVLLIGGLLSRQWPDRRIIQYSLLAFLGIFLIGSRAWTMQVFDHRYFWGTILGVATGASYACYLLSFRALRPGTWPQAFQNLGLVSLYCALLLALIAALEGSLQWPSGFGPWFKLLGLAVVCQVFGWLLISWGSTHMRAGTASHILLLQPILASLWGILLLEETWQAIAYVGVSLTLLAMFLTIKEDQKT
jgi:drug/metabolite transporter (DMT)-like permease